MMRHERLAAVRRIRPISAPPRVAAFAVIEVKLAFIQDLVQVFLPLAESKEFSR